MFESQPGFITSISIVYVYSCCIWKIFMCQERKGYTMYYLTNLRTKKVFDERNIYPKDMVTSFIFIYALLYIEVGDGF